MQYAALLYPHQNIRYRASLLQITRAELEMTLHALGHPEAVTESFPFLLFDAERLTPRDLRMLSQVAGIYMFFRKDGEALFPVPGAHPDYIGEDLPCLLKYKGKTNEMFTDALITMALSASGFMPIHDGQLIVLDPLGGKATTAFLALRRGYHGISLEVSRPDSKEAADYMNRYLEYHRIKFKRTESSLTVRGKTGARETKFVFSDTPEHFRDGDTRTLRLLCGDTRLAGQLLKSESVHLIVTDLPYGVQKGTAGKEDGILATVKSAVPGWFSVLKAQGALAVSFNTHVTHRQELQEVFEKAGFVPVKTPDLRHWVEQAIDRDVLLFVRPSGKDESVS
ncbi:MAG: site-specific DNA-methyltransferase [Clostridia bacterium]|nr:site-specific DNA-methyltransferase [Clostridia bacterium]